jgi:uncharacterized protein
MKDGRIGIPGCLVIAVLVGTARVRMAATTVYENLVKKARTGDVRAQVAVGLALLNGEGTANDPRSAAEWFRRAADSGDPEAQTQLGFLYTRGVGVQRDPVEAVRWFLRAAAWGYPPAQYDLGMIYLDGGAGQVNAGEGVRWLTRQGLRP